MTVKVAQKCRDKKDCAGARNDTWKDA